MRAKDTTRLDVIRSLRSAILNASKTPKPITNDAQLFLLLTKTLASSQTAIAEFKAASREDLVQKEQAQVAVLEEYMKEIPKMEKSEVERLINEAVATEKSSGREAKSGMIIGKVMRAIEGRKAVDMDMVVEMARRACPLPEKK